MDVEAKGMFSAPLEGLDAWRGLGEKTGVLVVGMRFAP